jgi:ribonuclease HI
MGRLRDTNVTTVNELIDDHQWNVPLIRQLFFAPDVDAILSIPLRRSAGEDWTAWDKEKSGVYSVRSAYRAIVDKNRGEEALRHGDSPSSSDNDTDVWKRLWKLQVVPKVRVFWWRVLRGILPDYGTLSRRHIRENSTCGICKAESETLMHALIECNHAKLFWDMAKDLLLVKLPRLHPATWSRDILCDPLINTKARAVIITVMYSIWSSRNNLTHGEAGYNPGKTMEVVRETLQALELPVDNDLPKSARPSCKWQKPPTDSVKINSDGAIRGENSSAATGVVARDVVSFRGALGKFYEGISDPLTAEALALRDAASYAVQNVFTRVVFEVDCVDLVRRWHGRLGDRSVIRPILDEISELVCGLVSYSISHTRREANQAAHSCAKFASIQEGSFAWEADPPGFLDHSLRADCNSMFVD